MITEIITKTAQYEWNNKEQCESNNQTDLKKIFQTRKAGHTIGMLIAERKYNRANENHPQRISTLARSLKMYEGILPDPFNQNRKLNITRLIACIDGR